jgi:hypothetical protein
VENFNTSANIRAPVNLDVPRVESTGRTLSRGYDEQSFGNLFSRMRDYLLGSESPCGVRVKLSDPFLVHDG